MSADNEGTDQTKAWLKCYDRLKTVRVSTQDQIWQDIANYVSPRKAGITTKRYMPDANVEAQIYDATATDSVQRAVAAYTSWTTPASQPWVALKPSLKLKSQDAVKGWLSECSQIINQEVNSRSNFQLERLESVADLWNFGTTAMFSEMGEGNRLRFEKIKIGTYVFELDPFGKCFRFIREFDLTAEQARQKFGEENLPKCITDCFTNEGASKDKRFDFIHIVEPREPSKVGAYGYNVKTRKKYLSAYVEMQSAKMVQEGGYDGFPFTVGRYLSYDSLIGNTGWGYGPGFAILPEARQLNFIQQMMDVFAEKQVFPPLLIPDTYEGSIKTAARAVNYYDSSKGPDSFGKLEVTGEWTVALERVRMRQDMIKRLCSLDMFQMFAQIDREMTAYEVAQRAGEKLDTVGPIYHRDVRETIEPQLRRAFELCAENGLLPPPPQEAYELVGRGFVQVADPEISLTSRLAMAIDAWNARGADEVMQTAVALAPVDPTVMDNIDTGFYIREKSRLVGAPEGMLRKPEDIAAIQQARAQAQAAQQAAMMAKDMGSAVNSVGGIEKARELVGA
jgi:hypothetical protein